MKKTFCDCCGEQCVNTTFYVNLEKREHTKNGEDVSRGEYKTAEICTTCADLVKRIIPQAFILRYNEPEMEMAMEAPVRDERAELRMPR